MAYKQCNQEYNYKGFLIRFSEYQQEWNIEPLFVTDEQLETLKNEYELPTARTISNMKKYIRENLETLTNGINEFLATKIVKTEETEETVAEEAATEETSIYDRMSLATLKDIADGKGLQYNKDIDKIDLINLINNDNNNDDIETINNNITIGSKVKIIASNPDSQFNQSDISKFIGITCTVTHVGVMGNNNDVMVDFIDPSDNKKVSMLLNENEYEVI